MQEEVTAILIKLRRYLEELYGDRLTQLILYGSQARGNAHSESDVDVLIVLKEPVDFVMEVKRTNDFITDLCLEYEMLISAPIASASQLASAQTPFFINVRREGLLV